MPELGLGFQAMDSPETSKLTTASTADSPPVQDSPFFNYISNLSPIACTKTRSTHVTHVLSRLNSPPIVFKSPRRKEPSETNVLKRSRSLQLSSPQASRSVGECAGAPVDSKCFIIRNGLIVETQKGCDVAGSSETPLSSSSGCVDEFLADPGEGDCVSSGKLATPTVKHSNGATASYRSGSKESKETALKFGNKNCSWINVEGNLDEPLVFLEDAEKNIQGGSESSVKLIERTEEQRDAKWPSHRFPNIKTSSHVSHALQKQSNQNSQARGIQHEHPNNLECVSHPSPGSFPLQINKDHSEDVGGVSDGLVGNKIPPGHEVNESHRGVRRRCLQFEEALPSSVRCNVRSSNLENTVCSSNQSTSAVDLETFQLRNAETNETSERLMVDLPQSTPSLSHAQSSENISMACKPLGIGLHLNSIVNAASLGCTATASKKLTDHDMVIGGMKSGMLESTSSCSTSLRVMEKDSTTNEERVCSTKAFVVASPVTYQFPHTMEDPYLAQDENENSNPQNAHEFEKTDQTSPKKKRKKATSSFDGDGCKNCNCKKSKCLKLYCDCFAAGVYCSDPCACQGCFNKPEYKDKVLETREQIESRNPLAFAPKIVQRISELPPNNGDDGNRATPSSARHKRGCNCKRSMCLKKYCECYQANVGCSSGCRCEGCKNVYGRKEEYVAIEHGATREIMGDIDCKERLERTIDRDLGRGDLLCAELINLHSLTPVTPAFQYSDNGKDAPKSRFLSKRYLPSPDSNLSILSSNEKQTNSPPRGMENTVSLVETHEALQTENSSDWQANNNVGKLGSFSSGSNVVCNNELSDLAIPIISASSRKDCINVLGNDHLLSRSLTRPGSPITPMTRLGGTKLSQVPDSGCELADILETDDMPVKVSSPNKKRVSPPHSCIYKLGSGSSGGIRSGRKFILKSVPSFPPLTPCIDSKGSSITPNTKKLQDDRTINK